MSWSDQFSPLTHWVVGGGEGTWGMIQQRFSSSLFCGRPLDAVLAWAHTFTLWCCPSVISSADHGIAHPPRWHEGWLRGCLGVWHARTMQVSVSCRGNPDPDLCWAGTVYAQGCSPYLKLVTCLNFWPFMISAQMLHVLLVMIVLFSVLTFY